MARIGALGRVAGTKSSKMIEVPGSAVAAFAGRAVLVRRDPVQLDVGQVRQGGLEIRVALADDEDEPRTLLGGTTAQARSSTASWSAGPVASASRPIRRTSSDVDVVGQVVDDRRPPGACGSRVTSRTSSRRSPDHSSMRRAACSRSRLATLMNTERVTPGRGQAAPPARRSPGSSRSRPTGRTLTGAATRPAGGVARAASVATRTCGITGSGRQLGGQLQRVAKVAASRGRGDALDGVAHAAEVGRLVDHDPGGPVGRDDADLAAGRQLAEGLDGGRLGRGQPVRGDVGRGHAGRGVDDEDDVPRQAGRPLQERAGREDRRG